MDSVPTFVLTIVSFLLLAALAVLFDVLVREPKRRREAEAAPRITLAEAQSYWKAIEESSLPIAKAVVQDRPPNSAKESRIGGAPLAIDADAVWPRDKDSGFPLPFIAQINFADLPQMEDFPESGVLQIFTSFEPLGDLFGVECIIRWNPDPQTDALLTVPDEMLQNNHQTFFSEKAQGVGLPLIFERDVAPGNPYNWPFDENDPTLANRLPESEDVAAIIDRWEERSERILAGYGDHWVGGDPSFVQEDVRHDPACRHLDRVLFHLGCNNNDINIGDGGQLNVMISRDALVKRAFQDAYLTWDCH
ncbi:MAG: YwqG family protein [Pseudomonadota bacterium]